ncbi:MAG: hypothetical protein QW705_01305 [Zestosphaera sp.]
MNRGLIAMLIAAIATAISWPLIVYCLYSVPPETAEAIMSVNSVPVPGRPPGFVSGVGGFVTLREVGFRARGLLRLMNHYMGLIEQDKDDGVMLALFMPRYVSTDTWTEVSGEDLAKLASNGSAVVLKGDVFASPRGFVLVVVEVTVGGRIFTAVPKR